MPNADFWRPEMTGWRYKHWHLVREAVALALASADGKIRIYASGQWYLLEYQITESHRQLGTVKVSNAIQNDEELGGDGWEG
ncbi:uncharacterized protein N7469_003120 [Penicillium citrinum]|uniref:Uncharacterized protein n=2 Tax=Penicillium TaxID=5073 RepID=A0A9W9PBS3_PENCI|nr:uncharacterized protein N7469_003120 [Penicillium citrinum]KAJ5241529.1 hypothetical protein N7469_003120 [Penicillium citrinum]KAJ5586540.1 hypothetical protein N7450_006327 [Penicillium hetheringtonii]